MSLRQVPNMNVISNTRAVSCRPVCTRNGESILFAQCRIHQFSEDMRRFLDMHAAAHLRIGSDRIEIPKCDPPHIISIGGVLQNHFHHIFCSGIGTVGSQWRILGHHEIFRFIINSGRRTEYDTLATQGIEDMKHFIGFCDILTIVFIRLFNGFRNDNQSRAM